MFCFLLSYICCLKKTSGEAKEPQAVNDRRQVSELNQRATLQAASRTAQHYKLDWQNKKSTLTLAVVIIRHRCLGKQLWLTKTIMVGSKLEVDFNATKRGLVTFRTIGKQKAIECLLHEHGNPSLIDSNTRMEKAFKKILSSVDVQVPILSFTNRLLPRYLEKDKTYPFPIPIETSEKKIDRIVSNSKLKRLIRHPDTISC